MLKRVSIQNFKSLKDVTIDLQKVNLLIGPNNSGKTNFLKALEYTARLNEENNSLSNNFFFKKNNSVKLEMYFVFENKHPFTPEDIYTHYRIITKGEQYDLNKINDIVTLERDDSKNFNIKPKNFSKSDGKFYTIQIKDMYYDFGKVVIYKPDPNKLDKPSPVGRGDDSLVADASNIIAFFDRIRDEYPATFAQIKADLAKCVPEFAEINFQNVASTEELVKQFGDKTFKRIGLTDGRQKTIYWADELSEGTLYFIALLCIINQPNPPKLLLLEEPEKGIHPRRIREVMDFIFRLADEKDVQIILTTHNEHVLDDFSTRPESVFVFDKDEEGATYVRNLQKDIIEPTNKRNLELGLDEIDLTTNLSENWLYGLLGGVPAIP